MYEPVLRSPMEFLIIERRTERNPALLRPITVQNISDAFIGDITAQKIAANWKNYIKPEKNSTVEELKSKSLIFEGLQNVEGVTRDFIDWWSRKDDSIEKISTNPSFEADVATYIVRQIWEFKYNNNVIVDPEVLGNVHRWKQLKAYRSAVHEAINRCMKYHLGEEGTLTKEQFDALTKELSEVTTDVFFQVAGQKIGEDA